MTVYQTKTRVRLTATFTMGGAAEDPDSVTFLVRSADGPVTSYTYGVPGQTDTAVRDRVGVYHADILTVEGDTWWRVESTGVGIEVAGQSYFQVGADQVRTIR